MSCANPFGTHFLKKRLHSLPKPRTAVQAKPITSNHTLTTLCTPKMHSGQATINGRTLSEREREKMHTCFGKMPSKKDSNKGPDNWRRRESRETPTFLGGTWKFSWFDKNVSLAVAARVSAVRSQRGCGQGKVIWKINEVKHYTSSEKDKERQARLPTSDWTQDGRCGRGRSPIELQSEPLAFQHGSVIGGVAPECVLNYVVLRFQERR